MGVRGETAAGRREPAAAEDGDDDGGGGGVIGGGGCDPTGTPSINGFSSPEDVGASAECSDVDALTSNRFSQAWHVAIAPRRTKVDERVAPQNGQVNRYIREFELL